MDVIEAKPGDAFFVRPGLPHATGAGLFLAEFQEPTDFSIVAEYKGFPIKPEEAHMYRGWDVMLDCFERGGLSGEDLATLNPRPTRTHGGTAAGWYQEDLLGEQRHPIFGAHRLVVNGSAPWPHAGVYAVVVVTAGAGRAETAHGHLDIAAGDTFVVLGGTAPTTISGNVEMIVGTPGLA